MPPSGRLCLLYHISGPDGAGKRSFIERLWQIVSQGEIPRILFKLDSIENDDVAAAFIAGARANRGNLDDALKHIAASLDSQATRLEEAGRPLPPEARLTVWADLLEQHILNNPRNNRDLQIIFALPGLLNYPPQLRQSIARLLPQNSDTVSTRVIVTSNKKNGDELGSLFPERMPPEEVPLPALTIDEVEEWARDNKFPAEFEPELYQRCGGLPGKLANAADEILQERQDRALILFAENILEDMGETQRENACMAAALPEINMELLKTLMSEEEAGSTIQALRNSDIEGSAWQNRTLTLGRDARIALTKYMERKYPRSFRKVQPVAEQFSRIHAAIPSPENREILCRLCAFNYFNEALLKEVLGSIGTDAARLVSSTPAYFENTGNNYRLRPELRQVVEDYMRLVKYNPSEADKKKIAACWEARRKEILESVTNSELKINKESESLSAVQGQIKRLGGEIESEAERLSRLRRRAQRISEKPSSRQKAPKNPAWQLALQAIGFVILYFGLLFSPRAAFIYVVIGLGLMVGGLFVKGGMLAAASTAPDVHIPPPNDLEQHERNLHFLHLKRGQLETRQNLIAMSMAKERSALKEFDKQLREPYS